MSNDISNRLMLAIMLSTIALLTNIVIVIHFM